MSDFRPTSSQAAAIESRGSAVLNAQPDADVHAAVLDRATGAVLYERTVRLPQK